MEKAIFLDIDETLLCRGKGPSPVDLEKIIEAKHRGHRVLVNTGRSLANLPEDLRDAPYLDGYVLGAGAHIILHGKTLRESWVSPEALQRICAFYLARKKWCAFEGERGVYAINRWPPFLFLLDLLPVERADAFSTTYRDDRITKITIQGSASEEERALLSDHFSLNRFAAYFEGIVRGASKAQGMMTVLEALGIPVENSVAVGDSLNDLDMISAAGVGVAMGNACDEIKRAARYVAADCAHGGVAEAIERWVLAPNP
ncbi:MAG: HAD hydrolase family protein [Spirochaetaceae bacterium]|jgi:Cof subfamily protein (haloacid dehalogenase superfamily)|nr:HAD hydrolase family protein [Spirochaetaceae bacterium]